MTDQEILSHVDHTLLKPEATWNDVQKLCDEAMEYHTASVCINTCYVKQAANYVKGQIPICCVIGFPLGAMDTKSKVFEARTAVENGATEVDMVINIGRLKNAEYDYVLNEINEIKAAIGDNILKVIVETCLLSTQEKIKISEIVAESNADFIKTSTGFSTGGATFDDVKLLKEHTKGKCRVKAAGGISTLEEMQEYLRIGADRIGTSRAIGLVK